MPERTFFALRHALPGYTFILVLLLVSYPRIQGLFFQSQSIELLGVFLAFLTILSGGAIGFLISQFWYVIHNSLLKGLFLIDAREFLEERYNLAKDVQHQIVFLDHVLHLSAKETIAYTQRRFDLIHTLASTLSATFIGLLGGILVRVEFFRTDIAFKMAVHAFWTASVRPHLVSLSMYDVGVSIIMVALSILLIASFLFVSKEHSMMVHVSVRKVVKSGAFPYSEARAYFPEDYFAKNGNESKS